MNRSKDKARTDTDNVVNDLAPARRLAQPPAGRADTHAQERNRELLGVDGTHKTPMMAKHKRGTFP